MADAEKTQAAGWQEIELTATQRPSAGTSLHPGEGPPKALFDDLLRQSRERRHEAGAEIPDLFADFNGIPKGVDKTEFYQYDQNWSNRMILGDSLQVMASLAEREGLRGKVPPSRPSTGPLPSFAW